MKNKLISVLNYHQVFFPLLMAFFLFSLPCCRKENLKTGNQRFPAVEVVSRSGTDDYALTTASVEIRNGMYFFPNYQELEKVINSLDTLEKDEEIYDLSLAALGFSDSTENNAPDEPVLEIFNRRFSISTLRQKCDEIDRSEDLGLVGEAEIDKVIIWDPVLGSIINQNNEIQVGNLVYRFLDDNQTLVFRADEQLINTVRNSPDLYNIPGQFNLFKIDARKPEDLELYKKIETANRSAECMFDITWSNNGNLFYFHSVGFFPVGGNVLWKIIDGNGTILQSQSGNSTFNYLIPVNATYPISVSIEAEGCDPHVELIAQNPPNVGYDCSTFTFDYSFSGSSSQLTVTFTIPANTPTVYWDFDGNGVTDLTTLPTGNASSSISHTYPDDDGLQVYTVCARVQTEECVNVVCKNIGAVGCGIENKRDRRRREYIIGVQGFKARIALKNPLFSESRVFIILKHYNVNGLLWTKEKADRLSAFWDASNNNFLGDLRYFTPATDGSCTVTEEGAIINKLSVKKIEGQRNLNKNSTIRKADFACEFFIRETVTGVTLSPGIPNPFSFTFRLGY